VAISTWDGTKFALTKSQLTLTWGVTHQEIYVESLLDRTLFDNTVSSAVQGGQLNLTRPSIQYNQSVPQVPVGYCVNVSHWQIWCHPM
jgi:hypothetical protein